MFGGYVAIEDTSSLHWTAGAFDRLLFFFAYGGILLLFIGIAFRFFAARLIAGATLVACIGFTVHALATYPSEYADAHAAPALSRTHQELYLLLAANVMLLLVVFFAPRIHSCLTRQKVNAD